jgi:membrane protein implicated in regulation of membrane protease activity
MLTIVSDLFTTAVWIWLGIGAVLLLIELPTTTGWLLAPSLCAFVLAGLNLVGVQPSWPWQVVAYAAATIVLTLIARSIRPRLFHRLNKTPDINDRAGALLGKTGRAVGPFSNGAGRVLVDGAEWEAEVESGEPPAAGGKVEVVRVLGGARLAVRPV